MKPLTKRMSKFFRTVILYKKYAIDEARWVTMLSARKLEKRICRLDYIVESNVCIMIRRISICD